MVSKFFWTLVASVNRRDDSPGYELLWRRGLSSVEPMLCRGAMFVGICTKNSKIGFRRRKKSFKDFLKINDIIYSLIGHVSLKR